MKEILLIKINYPRSMNFPPLGLLYVGGALRRAGYKVEIRHLSARDDFEQLARLVADKDYLFVGCSAFTGDPLRSYAMLCRRIKAHGPTVPIVWGGVHPSLCPTQCLSEDYIDMVVIGEGEETSLELAAALENGQDLSTVAGLGFKRDGRVIINECRPFIKDLDDYPIDWSLVRVEDYLHTRARSLWEEEELSRMLPIVTSRGCPYNCSFCYNQNFNRRRWRSHSVTHVLAEIEYLKSKCAIDGLLFYDDEFFVQTERAFQILEKVDLPYYAECRIDRLGRPFVERLARTRCRQLLIGIESGSDRILNLFNKRFTVADIKRAFTLLAEFPNINVSGSLILASPTESQAEFRQSIELMIELLEIHPRLGYTVGFYLPYPGTQLFELAKEHGFEVPTRTEDWEDLDRWTSKFKISWSTWATSEDTRKVRFYTMLLQKCHRNRRTRLLLLLIKWRLRFFSSRDSLFKAVLSRLEEWVRAFLRACRWLSKLSDQPLSR